MKTNYEDNPSARRIIASWIKKFQETKQRWLGMTLENVIEDISIDYKDYGADQNVELGQQLYN